MFSWIDSFVRLPNKALITTRLRDFLNVAICEQLDLRCRRRHAFLEEALAEQRVDERALSGVEFADDDDEKEVVELADGRQQRGAIVGRGAEFDERVAQRRQQLARRRELGLGGRFKYPQHNRCTQDQRRARC